MLLLIGSCSLAATTSAGQHSSSDPNELVWRWFGDCPSTKEMRIQVQLDDNLLYANAFPACRVRSGATAHDAPPKMLTFSFRAPAARFGPEFRTLGVTPIRGDIWQAGAESDAMVLGVSFMTPGRILLNTVHIARPGRASQSELVEGLAVSTSAVQEKAGPDHRGAPVPQNKALQQTKRERKMFQDGSH